MSEENVELAQRASEMFNRRDLHGFLALMAEDVRFEPQMGPRFEGHDGIHRLWNSLIGGPGFTVEVVRLRDLGADLMLAAVHARGEGVGAVNKPIGYPAAGGRENAFGGASSWMSKRPSKSSACGSRRCRRRTWSWCAECLMRSTGETLTGPWRRRRMTLRWTGRARSVLSRGLSREGADPKALDVLCRGV
jgi:hypothetical protein